MSASARRPICLIVNPAAGGGRAGRLAPSVEQALAGHGLQVRRVDTRDLDHARELTALAAAAGETVVALSGDGMIGAIAHILRTVPDSLLGVLPGGRGNDLVRVLGIPEDPIAACAVIAHGVPRAIDLGEVEGQVFVGIASAGFDSDANRIANEAPSRLGNLVYAYGALRALVSWRPAHFEVQLHEGQLHEGKQVQTPYGQTRTIDSAPAVVEDGDGAGSASKDRRFSFSGYTIAAANSGVYGGGMRLAPDARLDDGLLDIVAIERVSKPRFLANLPRVFKGTHVRLPSVKVFQAAEMTISADRPFTLYADGDPIAQLPARIRALPGAVRVLVPGGP